MLAVANLFPQQAVTAFYKKYIYKNVHNENTIWPSLHKNDGSTLNITAS